MKCKKLVQIMKESEHMEVQKKDIIEKDEHIFQIGENVVHIPEGVCTITEIVKMKNMDSAENEYYKLVPVMDKSSAIYVKMDFPEKHMRRLRSREEILEILETQKKVKPLWDSNEQKRISKRRIAIKEDDGIVIAKLIRSYRHRRKKEHLNLSDSNWLKMAEQFWGSEVAVVLDMDYDVVISSVWENE